MKKIVSTLIIFLQLAFLCKAQNGSFQSQLDYDSLEKLQVIRFVEDSTAKKDRQELFLRNIGRHLGLPYLNNGMSGLYIRIWLWNAERKYVINISKDGDKKKCDVIEYGGGHGDSSYYLIIFHEWHDLQPKSGWKNFFEMISKYNISSLESGTIQNKRKDAATGLAYVQFEIAQANSYRFYEYLEPSYYRVVDSLSNKVDKFLHFFNQEMRAKVYYAPGSSTFFARPDKNSQ